MNFLFFRLSLRIQEHHIQDDFSVILVSDMDSNIHCLDIISRYYCFDIIAKSFYIQLLSATYQLMASCFIELLIFFSFGRMTLTLMPGSYCVIIVVIFAPNIPFQQS